MSARDNHEHLDFSASVSPRPGGGSVVTIMGELDGASSPQLTEAFERAIAAGGEVELDMRACSFIDSAGVAAIVKEARQLREQGGVLKVRGARERVRHIMELAGLVSQGWVVLEPA